MAKELDENADGHIDIALGGTGRDDGFSLGVESNKVSGEPGSLLLYEDTTTETNGTGFLGPDSATTNIYYKFPDGVPTQGYVWSFGTAQDVEVDGVMSKVIPLTPVAGTGETSVTIQSGDPDAESSVGWYMATSSGDTFYKSAAGLFNVSAGTYTEDPTAPNVSSITIAANGTAVTIAFDKNVSAGAGGSGGVTLSTPSATLTYSSGAGTSSLVFTSNVTILSSDTPTCSYTQPGNGLETTTGGIDLASFSNHSVTNNSTQTAGLSVSDTFTGTENPLATNWTTVTAYDWYAMQKTGGSAIGSTGSAWNAAYWDADSPGANQFAKITLTGSPSYHGVILRDNANGAYLAYAHSNGTRVYVYRLDKSGMVYTSLVDGASYITTTVASGATLELRISGSTLTCLVNDVSVGTLVTDNTYASGNIGIMAFGNAVGIDSFEGGEL